MLLKLLLKLLLLLQLLLELVGLVHRIHLGLGNQWAAHRRRRIRLAVLRGKAERDEEEGLLLEFREKVEEYIVVVAVVMNGTSTMVVKKDKA